MWKSIITHKRILSEAPFEGEDFQLTNDELGLDGDDFATTEVPGASPASGQPAGQVQQNPETEGDPEAMGDSAAEGEPDAMGMGEQPLPGVDMEPQLPKETETDKIKKLVLLDQYKKLLELCEKGQFSLSYITKLNDFKDDELLSYLKESLKNLNDKIVDVISYHFLTAEYVELLRKFYYLKYNLKAIMVTLAKISEKYNKQQKN